VRLNALADAPYAFGSTWEHERLNTEQQWRRAVESRARFVADVGGEVVGIAAAGDSGDPRAAALTSVWVDSRARGTGVGDSLVQTAVAWAVKAGYAQLILWVTDGNTHAETLYRRHGFARTGSVQQVRPGEDHLEFEMSRSL
jgi:GNAT superfamily N-acetyltransferase